MLKLDSKKFPQKSSQPKNNSATLPKIRLFVKAQFVNGAILNHKLQIANDDFNYLVNVMRQKIDDKIIIFNGVVGDFIATICEINKKILTLEIKEKIRDLKPVPNITLAFAPVKNVRIDFIASKACELGVKNFQPLITQRTIVDKINIERFEANIKEACEQCGRNDIAQILTLKKIETWWREDLSNKILILCDESGLGKQASELFPQISYCGQEIVIITGPEGGFSPDEFTTLRNLPNCYALNLGPRILRADTAIISALTLVQEFLGDFNLKANFI